ncbi:hypothetical protein ACFSKL_10295 [Belliella marina]|uniref:DUF4259 domain-containing protein n=1 Tax=Belliella marina TaxID=1644146 RepID=A0ABW4VMK5_9BACT
MISLQHYKNHPQMGSWGTGISSNDIFEDIKDEFFELYNDGYEPNEIAQKLIDSNQEIVNDYEEANNFWFALALCQWECKLLEPRILMRVTQIIESGNDIKLWKELGADKSEVTKRKKILEKFLEKLNSEKKNPKRREKKIFRDSIFKKGHCLSVQLSNGLFGAAFVLESEEQTEYGLNLIALCDYISDKTPTVEFFEKANVLFSKDQDSPDTYKDYPLVSWYMAPHYKANEVDLKIIGSIEIKKSYNNERDYMRYVHWKYIPSQIEDQAELVAKHGEIKMKLKLSSLRIKTWL